MARDYTLTDTLLESAHHSQSARLKADDQGMPFLIGIYLIQIATVLITAALYKSIQRIIKYTPDGRQLSPMRPRSLLTRKQVLMWFNHH